MINVSDVNTGISRENYVNTKGPLLLTWFYLEPSMDKWVN